ncbi:MAG TPA: 16S rRNA (cytidine(1402)-2'-O)-methyltransferase [Candidatus Doudnabacteria bacterium]|nr:16S rRNA (cytidine(1402)-2'-O)-methyltransferase [Candidatus Doudnabacteria bacterium]
MLYIVPTPIGNLEDITARAKHQLSACDFIIAENPTEAHKLLGLLSLPKKEVRQFADHNETKVIDELVMRIQSETACLVTDAGTPGISDPGFRLVRAAKAKNIAVISLPGPNAAITALVGSGLPTDKFLFVGFLPKTELKLIKVCNESAEVAATLIAYDSPHRLKKTLGFLEKNFPTAKVVIARELTKLHEEYITGTPEEILTQLKERASIKGEVTIIISFK